MTIYSCPRCGYCINNKTIYIRHLNRKIICKNILTNDDLQSEYLLYGIKDKMLVTKRIQNIPKTNFDTSEINKNISNIKVYDKIDLNENHNLDERIQNIPKKSNICIFCDTKFSSISNLNKHSKNCKERIKIDEANNSMKELVKLLNKQLENQKIYFEKKEEEQKKEIENRKIEYERKEKELKLELDKRNKQIDELIKKAGIQNNGTITNNIQNNIKLLAYKDTDISKLSDNDFIKCINHNNMCIPQLIKMIHLDPKKPENHNIYISNLKNGYVMLYDGRKWNAFNRDETINDLLEDKQSIIEEKLEDWITKGEEYPELMKKFKRYLNKKENNEILNKIKEEIKLMLYNNRKIISNYDIDNL